MTAIEAATAARFVGFEGDGLVTIVAISGAEADFEDATNNTARPDRPGYRPLTPEEIAAGWQPEYSVGPLAIDLEQHGAEIAEYNARSFNGAFAWGYRNSAQGTDFRAWSTYTAAGEPPGTPPAYLAYMDAARAAVEATMPPPPPDPPLDPNVVGLNVETTGDTTRYLGADETSDPPNVWLVYERVQRFRILKP